MKRSNLIVSLGLAVFVVGAATTYLLVKDNGDESSSAGKQTVLVAAENISAGTTGSAAVENKLVKTKNVAPSAKPANALIDPSQLSGKVAGSSVPKGAVLTTDQFSTSQTTIGTLEIPEGMTAMAVQLAHVPGVAGFAGAKDKVNVYGLTKPEGNSAGLGKLVLQNVEVLNVNGTTLAAAQGQAGGPGLVYLLAVTPEQGERIAYLTTFGQLYFSLVEKGANPAPVPSTPGVDPTTALEQLS